jgi:AcrR family transcriptional regulator
METTKSEISSKAAQILMQKGLKALTLPNLANELGVTVNQLSHQIKNVDDIILMLLMEFEVQINEYIQIITNHVESADDKFKLLFKGLYYLFMQKPHYLFLLFDKDLNTRDEQVKECMSRIKKAAELCLTGVLNTGKRENRFKTKASTAALVESILISFRSLMQQEQRINEMALELKTIKSSFNSFQGE